MGRDTRRGDPVGRPRAGWDEDFRRMAAAGDDAPLLDDSLRLSTWDHTEWEWPEPACDEEHAPPPIARVD